MRTHERGLEEVARDEDLVGGGEPHDPGAVDLPLGAAADLSHAVEAGREQDEDGGRHGTHHDGRAPPLEMVEREHGQLPQRRLEEQRRRHRGLRREHREEELDHRARAVGGGKRRGGAEEAGIWLWPGFVGSRGSFPSLS